MTLDSTLAELGEVRKSFRPILTVKGVTFERTEGLLGIKFGKVGDTSTSTVQGWNLHLNFLERSEHTSTQGEINLEHWRGLAT